MQSAAASGTAASSLYANAVEEVQFRGRKDKVEAYTEWRKKNADLLRSNQMQTAIELYLKYALLAVQRKGIDKPETLLPATMAYVQTLINADASLREGAGEEVKNLLDKPLRDSVIAQYLNLGPWLPDDKSWEAAAGNINVILEKNIRPLLREAKDPQLIQTWDLQMKVEADRITAGRSTHKAGQFNAVDRPKLIFLRAQDMAAIGQPNRAVTEMFTLVRSHPEHPDFSKWVAEIRKSIKPVETPASTPAAETSPQ